MVFASLVKRFSLDYQQLSDDDDHGSSSNRGYFGRKVIATIAFSIGVVCAVAGLTVAIQHQLEDKSDLSVEANPADFIPEIPLFGTPPSPQWSGVVLGLGTCGKLIPNFFISSIRFMK